MTLEQGQIFNDRYRIAALIHQTQSGSVYRAWDLYNQNVCVLKERRYTAGEENQDLAGSFRSEGQSVCSNWTIQTWRTFTISSRLPAKVITW